MSRGQKMLDMVLNKASTSNNQRSSSSSQGQIMTSIFTTNSTESNEEQQSSNTADNVLDVSDNDDYHVGELSDSGESYRPSDHSSEDTDDAERNEEGTDQGERRKRKGNKELWKRNIVKKKRMSGQAYTNRSGKKVSAKIPKAVDCSSCRYSCSNNFPDEERHKLCQEYWKLGNTREQKLYVSSLVQNVPVSRIKKSASKHKGISRVYYLRSSCGERMRVCQKFFCSTFSISHRVVELCMRDTSSSGLYEGHDRRANRKPVNATTEESINVVKAFIDQFPRIPSHYCRKDSRKLYLSPELNISKMYLLYKEYCTEKETIPVSLFVYSKIFHDYDPPLSFFTPKKDQCMHCNIYNETKEKSDVQEEWELHRKRADEAMQMKSADKAKCLEDKGEHFRAISFDLQAILNVPYAGDNQLFYRRKLNIYNFTIYDNHKSNGHCYIWDECNGKKGSSEISSCLLSYLLQLPTSVTHVSSFSDTCGGQNRNKNIAAAMLYAVNKIDNLNVIDLKYMESGHSYLEADSMHACIERAKKHKRIYSTREWALIVSAARNKPRPYDVNVMKFNDFFDMEKLTKDVLLNTSININKEKVHWLKIKWLQFNKVNPFIIKYKYNLSEEGFMEIDVTQKRSGRKKEWNQVVLSKKYLDVLPVSEEKKKDLNWMLEHKIIPSEYKQFYDEIKSGRVRDFDSDDD